MRTLGILLCLSLAACASAGGRSSAAYTPAQETARKRAQEQAARRLREKMRLDPVVVAEPAPLDDSELVRVVVLPFQVGEALGNRGRFESLFLASSLADTLVQSPWVADAYVSPVPSEAVEILMEGEVTHSAADGVDVRLTCRRGGELLFSEEYGIRVAAGDSDGRTSPVRKLWRRPTNRLGQVLHELQGSDEALDARIARYLEAPGLAPSEDTRELFVKASAIEHANLLGPITEMVDMQVEEVEPSYVSWRTDTLRAEATAARYRQEAAEAREAAEKIERSAKRTAAAGIGLSLLRGFADAQAGNGVNALQLQADMQPFLDAAERSEKRAEETQEEARHLARQADAAFATGARFADVFESSLADLTITLEDRVYTLVGAVDAQISQLRTIIRDLARQEIEDALAAKGPQLDAPESEALGSEVEQVASVALPPGFGE